MTLQSIIEKNPGKATTENLQILIKDLRHMQKGLDIELQSDRVLYNKIINACQQVSACSFACYRPSPTLAGLIGDLQSSITTYELAHKKEAPTYFVDRKYHKPGQPNNRFTLRPNSRKRCFVCQKEGCWSTKHTPEERQRSRARFKQRFDKRIDQYIEEYESHEDGPVEGEEPEQGDDDVDDLNEAIEVLLTYDEPAEMSTTLYSSTFHTTFGNITQQEGHNMAKLLANQTVQHTLCHTPFDNGSTLDNDPFTYKVGSANNRYSSDQFYGIMLDSGASAKSTGGYCQYMAYVNSFGGILDKTTAGLVKVQFGIGSAASIGSLSVNTPIGAVEFHIVEADTPFLMCLKDMDDLKVYFNNLKNVLIREHDKRTFPVVRKFGHPFMVWGPMTINYLTETELRQLHRRFGHPSAERLVRLLERAGHDDDQHRKVISRIIKYCSLCQRFGRSPGRFKFTVRDDIAFNHTVVVDVMYIDNLPILHVVDEATRFQAARWLQNISSECVWNTLRHCWIDVYLGPPDLLVHDAGTNFTSKKFQQNANSMAISTKCVPVEAAHSIGLVERYHAPLRKAYEVIREELKGDNINKAFVLQMAVKAVNDTAGPDGLVPTLLVFGSYPRMTPYDPPAPTITQRAAAVRKAITEVSKLHAKRQVTAALRARNGPNVEDIHALALGSDVLVWRTHIEKWTGPYRLLAVEDETCTVELPSGPTNFRSTSVKPYISDSTADADEVIENQDELGEPHENEEGSENEENDNPRRNPPRDRRLPARFRDSNIADITVYIVNPPGTDYTESRKKELDGLLERKVFEIVHESDIAPTARIFKSRFVDEVKFHGTDKAYEKSRLVVQAYNDDDKKGILTQSPTIQRVSQRILLTVALLLPNMKVCLRDISQAYTQSTTSLIRDIYIRAPAEMNVPEGYLLRVCRPLYGIPEAGTHWFHTYHKHHTTALAMTSSTFDPCLLFTDSSDGFGMVGLQTDDSLMAGDDSFYSKEESALKAAKFLAKPRETLMADHRLNFNGYVLTLDNGITITQDRQIDKITPLRLDEPVSKADFIAQRARGAYIASVCQPQASFALSFSAQTTEPGLDHVKVLNKCLTWQKNNKQGLKFIKLDLNTLKVVAFTDSSFANNSDHSSQIGFVIVLADGDNNANIVHWSSVKCKRVTRSVLASELYALTHGFDIASVVKATLMKILSPWRSNDTVPLVMCIDSKSLYDCLVKLGTTREKRLMVDMMCLRQAYERREVAEILWIDGDRNPADAMTKVAPCGALKALIASNKVDLAVVDGWVERG